LRRWKGTASCYQCTNLIVASTMDIIYQTNARGRVSDCTINVQDPPESGHRQQTWRATMCPCNGSFGEIEGASTVSIYAKHQSLIHWLSCLPKCAGTLRMPAYPQRIAAHDQHWFFCFPSSYCGEPLGPTICKALAGAPNHLRESTAPIASQSSITSIGR
jgi:hypothetical protein